MENIDYVNVVCGLLCPLAGMLLAHLLNLKNKKEKKRWQWFTIYKPNKFLYNYIWFVLPLLAVTGVAKFSQLLEGAAIITSLSTIVHLYIESESENNLRIIL